MKASEIIKEKERDKKPQGLTLSKKHLLQLIEGKKIKTARKYIDELGNANPKAQKYIRQVLEEIFCQRKASSAIAYLYGLVFYKNLLLSGQLDYYEDSQFFPVQIHLAIAGICQYNQKQPDLKLKGTEYFKNGVKVESNQKTKEDLQAMGVGVVIYAMELLQSMAEWYKEGYFTGEESIFLKKYKQFVRRGIVFPKESEYIYIKEQDRKEFKQKYLQLLQNGQEQVQNDQLKEVNPTKSQAKQKILEIANPKDKNAQLTSLECNDKRASGNRDQQKREEVNLSEPRNQLTLKESKTPVNVSKLKQSVDSAHKQQNTTQKQQHNFTISSLDLPSKLLEQSRLNLIQFTSKQLQSINKKTAQPTPIKHQDQNQISQFSDPLLANSKVIVKVIGPEMQMSEQKTQPTLKQQLFTTKNQKSEQCPFTAVNPSANKTLKRTQSAGDKGMSQILSISHRKQENSSKKTNSKTLPRAEIISRRKHKIFQTNTQKIHPTSKNQFFKNHIPMKNDQFKLNLPSNHLNLNNLSSNISFSPNIETMLKYDSLRESSILKKKSVPKTQKKTQKTLAHYEDLASKLNLTQNLYSFSHKKKSSQKFPMKTLSSWRYQKQIKTDFSFQTNLNYKTLIETLKKLKFKKSIIPFIPEYFDPVTIKMCGLRKSALEITGYAQTSQVFFNNRIIQARLMKPTRNCYILSILNISRLPLKISLADMNKIPYSKQIKFSGNNFSQFSTTKLNSGCYMDIHFSFQTSNLNFKFLKFELLIDSMILSLQLPITLLDQCILEKEINVEEILSYTKNFGKIIESETFKLNIRELPNFIKKKRQVVKNDRQLIHSQEEDKFWSFTLKIKLKESQCVSSLKCCIFPCSIIDDGYKLAIIFDSVCGSTQDFAKVIIQLFTFLLWE